MNHETENELGCDADGEQNRRRSQKEHEPLFFPVASRIFVLAAAAVVHVVNAATETTTKKKDNLKQKKTLKGSSKNKRYGVNNIGCLIEIPSS